MSNPFMEAVRKRVEERSVARRAYFKKLQKPLGLKQPIKRNVLQAKFLGDSKPKGRSIGRKLAREDRGKRGDFRYSNFHGLELGRR